MPSQGIEVGYLGCRRRRPRVPRTSRTNTITLLPRVLVISPVIPVTSNIVVPRDGLCGPVMLLFAWVYEESAYEGPPPMIKSKGLPPVKSFRKNEPPVKLNCHGVVEVFVV